MKTDLREKKTIKIQYVKSMIATPQKHRLVIKGLGLRKLNQIV